MWPHLINSFPCRIPASTSYYCNSRRSANQPLSLFLFPCCENEAPRRLACLDSRWLGGRCRRCTEDDLYELYRQFLPTWSFFLLPPFYVMWHCGFVSRQTHALGLPSTHLGQTARRHSRPSTRLHYITRSPCLCVCLRGTTSRALISVAF